MKGSGAAGSLSKKPPESNRSAPFSTDQYRTVIRQLVRERERRQLTQTEVARRMGTSQPYVARLEAGASDPRVSTLMRYATIAAGGIFLAKLLEEMFKGAGRR